jgi:L-cysteine S-thiosulfotransferase
MRAILQSAVAGLGLAFAISGAAMAAELAPAEVKFTDDMTVEVSLTGTPGDPAKGREVFANRRLGNCLACHANTDMKDQLFHGDVGPSLDGVGSRWNEAQLRAILVDSKKVFTDTTMPGFYIMEFTGGKEPTAGKITLTAPEIAENGNTVPISVIRGKRHVGRRPGRVGDAPCRWQPAPGRRHLPLHGIERQGRATTRMRLAKTQNVIAVAKMKDGSVYIRHQARQGHHRRLRRLRLSKRITNMAMAKPRVKVPKTASAGEVITIKTLISHEMESGQRKDKDGNVIPRKIINKFTCEFNGTRGVRVRHRPGDLGQPVFRVHRQGERERHVQVHLGGRRRHGLHRREEDRSQLTKAENCGPGRQRPGSGQRPGGNKSEDPSENRAAAAVASAPFSAPAA